MRPIDADETLRLFDNDLETMKTKIEGKVPFQVGAAMVCAAKEIRTSLKETLDQTPTLDCVPRQQWISVKDDLPAAVVAPYLIYADGWMQVADWSHDRYGTDWWFYVDGEYDPEVTHWMPLPEPPKEDER